MIEAFSDEVLWIVIVGFIMAFVLAFGIGANDVANSFGTSVGSKVLTVRQACYLATVFEIAGAVLIGYKVSDTMRKGILQVDVYDGDEKELMLGMFASLIGSSLLLLLATFFRLPVSATHGIVGATIGFSLVCRGDKGLNWVTLGTIVMSGVISVVLFILIRRYILNAERPLIPGLRSLPIFYGLTILINVFSIVHDGPSFIMLYFDRIPWWGALLISIGIGLLTSIVVQFFVVPRMRKQVEGSVQQKSETPIYILLYGGVGISVGLWIWGRRSPWLNALDAGLSPLFHVRFVLDKMVTVGFTIEIGAAFTVLLASKIGLPISTTHCKVGSVVFVGWASTTKQGVDWKLFRLWLLIDVVYLGCCEIGVFALQVATSTYCVDESCWYYSVCRC
ncbi:Sodium-dependent phosphate transporter 1-A [Blattella germanica]|nr:Sodium-dependent phosphate transporter 1-A [Blattella germanica]